MALVPNGRASLMSFLLGVSVVCFQLIAFIFTGFWYIFTNVLYCVLCNAIVWAIYHKRAYSVAVRAVNLGLFFGIGLLLTGTSWCQFGWYMSAMAFFHWSEYFATAVTNPKHLALESYLLDHSLEYYIAASASCLEFTIEWYFFPGLKQYYLVSCIGLFLVAGGEALRKAAMFRARTNFNHYVQHVKEEGHELVTHGVYSYCRHPAYVGWFYWSIGTQLMLCNPVCFLGYTVVSWKFFNERIFDEEIALLNFFGESYLDYQKRVGTGLPFIKGYRASL